MDLTKDLNDYLNIINQTINLQQFKFKLEKYGYIDKCTQINFKLNEVDTHLKSIIQTSKTSSLFNQKHLKYNKIGKEIEDSIKFIEKALNNMEKEDMSKYLKNGFERKVILNSIDLLKDKLSEIGGSYQKFLKNQADLIRQIEKRKANIVNTSKRPKLNNDLLYSSTDPDGSEMVDLVDKENTMTMSQMENNSTSQYYQDRSNAVQHIEKAMNDLVSMFNKVSEMVYRQRNVVERISDDTDISYQNITMGTDEIRKLKEDVKDNRKLIMKIFGIILVFVVVYIVFIS